MCLDIILCILYFKIENNDMCSIDTIEKNKNSEYLFNSTIFKIVFIQYLSYNCS